MATNDFLPFATATGANVLSQADWAALSQVPTGFTSGILPGVRLNKALRQSSAITSAFAQVVSNILNAAVQDNGDLTTLQLQIAQVLGSVGQRTTIIATSQAYTVPAGVYFLSIRMWGAGGSGATTTTPANPGGGGGGGGYCEKVIAVTPGQSIAVTVGVGTAAGTGGSTSFGSFATAVGGGLATNGTSSAVGQAGVGGTAYGGDLNLPGTPGSNGFTYGAANVEGGRGGPAFGGGHTFASGGSSIGFNANGGTFPGGGSSGCTLATAPGGNGLVIIGY